MRTWLIITLASASLAGCADNTSTDRANGYTQGPRTAEDSLFQQVMDGHNVAMARHGRMAGYAQLALRRADSITKAGGNAVMAGEYRALADTLHQADAHMNAWMDNFNVDSARDYPQQRIAYLKSEQEKIFRVRDEVLRAVALADSLLKK